MEKKNFGKKMLEKFFLEKFFLEIFFLENFFWKFFFFWKFVFGKLNFGKKICIGPSIRIGREIRCLPYAGFFNIIMLVDLRGRYILTSACLDFHQLAFRQKSWHPPFPLISNSPKSNELFSLLEGKAQYAPNFDGIF